MSSVCVTGGSGFLGSLLIARLLNEGHEVTSIDLLPNNLSHPRLTAIVGDIRDRAMLDAAFAASRPVTVYHCAALLAHGSLNERGLWSSNVEGTRTLAAAIAAARIRSVVYTSSNCLWGHGFDRPVREDDAPAPIEIYGHSKWEGEKILLAHAGDFATTVIRCPTIMDEGRLGLLSILFEFIAEGRRVWVVGDGGNRYQFIAASDLIAAMLMAGETGHAGVYGIGSDDVSTMRDTYAYVIDRAGTGARIASLPKGPTILGMQIAHHLKISPLGPYHYRMIAADFVFDTSAIKRSLGWRPALTNQQMLFRAYDYYARNRAEIEGRSDASAHRKSADMGVIRLLKWIS